MKLKTTHEKNVRPEYDAAASKLSKATDALADARAELATAEANVKAHEALADTEDEKPKDWAHDGAELTAAVTWFERMVQSKASTVAEAQAEHDAAHCRLALAQMEDRAATIAAFDRDEFISRYAAKLAPIAAEAWSELHALTDLEAEVRTIAKGAGIDRSNPRYSVPDAGSGSHAFDGINLNPAGLSSSAVTEALAAPEDPRLVAYREQIAAADAERRQAQRELDEAEKEWAKEAPMREARARFEQAHDNWEKERNRRVRNMETTATMNPEPVFSNRASW